MRLSYGEAIVSTAGVVWGRIIIRGEDGPTGELGPPEAFIVIKDNLYPVKQIVASPPVLEHQVKLYRRCQQ